MPEPVAEVEIDETEIVLKLIGTHREREDGLNLAYKKFGEIVFRYVVSRAPGLPTASQKEATLEAFRVLHRLSSEPNFDIDKPLLPLLFTLANRKAIDLLRTLIRHRDFAERLDEDENLAAEVAKRLVGTDVGFEWKLAVSQERAKEIQERFRALIPTLPAVQQLVAQVMSDALPGDLKDNELADAIYALSGSRPTVVQVRSARAQVRQKFRAILKSSPMR
jgi:DNA-directed RNA polymerase specialized sigma24 family protein